MGHTTRSRPMAYSRRSTTFMCQHCGEAYVKYECECCKLSPMNQCLACHTEVVHKRLVFNAVQRAGWSAIPRHHLPW